MKKRILMLRGETVRALETAELTDVVGGIDEDKVTLKKERCDVRAETFRSLIGVCPAQ